MTFNGDQDKFIVFNLQGQMVQSLDSPINGIVTWNIAGVNLMAVTGFTVAVYRIHSQTYYAKMDKGYYLGGNPQRPTVDRVKLCRGKWKRLFLRRFYPMVLLQMEALSRLVF